MNNIILDEMKLNFKDIEKEIFDVVCEAGLSRIRLMFEDLDKYLCENRDKKDIDIKIKLRRQFRQ